jgi:hypothetical protein
VGGLEPVQSSHVDGELDKPSLQGFQGKISRVIIFTKCHQDNLLNFEEF